MHSIMKISYVYLILLILWFAGDRESAATEVQVINSGRNGQNSRQFVERFEKDALSHKPDLIVLGGGTNDAINSRNAVELLEYSANIRTLIERSHSNGIQLILITAIPCVDTYVLQRHPAAFFQGQAPSTRVKDYVNEVLKLGEELKVPVINLYQAYEERGQIGELETSWIQNESNSGRKDGVHPTAEGYAVIAEKVYQQIMKQPNLPKRIVCLGDSITFGAGVRTKESDASYPAQLLKLFQKEVKTKGNAD